MILVLDAPDEQVKPNRLHFYMDGKKVGSSPLIKHKLKAGKHTVKLVNKDLEIVKILKVTIKKGEHTTIVKDLL